MLKLLTCAQGHFWEVAAAEEEDLRTLTCPVCGEAADALPLLDLVSTTPPAPSAPPAEPAVAEEKPGPPVVAGYEIQESLKRGPTGVAQYRARQTLVGRTVLLKVVLAREDPGQTAWGSLRGEASALGRLTHPNIVQIFEAGERDRQLFYNVVEYVEGPSLGEKLGDEPLPWRQAARLVETLARAIQHAHDRSIVHRNLKPASIRLQLLARVEGRELTAVGPSPFCQVRDGLYLPRITDFGLARRPVEGEITDVELFGPQAGYLSPEQVWGRARELGPATDIYALGALLYRLLTGQAPFRGRTRQEIIDAIQSEEPVPPAQHQRGIPADLDFVCRKCLSRQPRRRYATARDLADDLASCVESRPIKARLTGRMARAVRWARRQPALAALLGLLVVVMIASFVTSLVASREMAEQQHELSRLNASEKRANERVAHALEELRHLRQAQAEADYQRQILQAVRALNQNQPQQAEELLRQCGLIGQNFWEWHYLNQVLALRQPTLVGHFGGRITSQAFSPDGRMLAVAGSLSPNEPEGRGEVQVYSTFTGAPVFDPLSFAVTPQALAFSFNGRHLAVAANQAPLRPENGVAVWSVPARVYEYSVWLGSSPVTGLAYESNNGVLDAIEKNGYFSIIDTEKRPPIIREGDWTDSGRSAQMAVSASSSRIATCRADMPGVTIRGVRRPEETIGRDEQAVFLAFDPAHPNLLGVAGASGHLRIWNVDSKTIVQSLMVPRKSIRYLAYSRDGKRLATQCTDGSVQVWDPRSGQLLLVLRETTPLGAGVAFSANGRRLAISGVHEVKIWGAAD